MITRWSIAPSCKAQLLYFWMHRLLCSVLQSLHRQFSHAFPSDAEPQEQLNTNRGWQMIVTCNPAMETATCADAEVQRRELCICGLQRADELKEGLEQGSALRLYLGTDGHSDLLILLWREPVPNSPGRETHLHRGPAQPTLELWPCEQGRLNQKVTWLHPGHAGLVPVPTGSTGTDSSLTHPDTLLPRLTMGTRHWSLHQSKASKVKGFVSYQIIGFN